MALIGIEQLTHAPEKEARASHTEVAIRQNVKTEQYNHKRRITKVKGGHGLTRRIAAEVGRRPAGPISARSHTISHENFCGTEKNSKIFGPKRDGK